MKMIGIGCLQSPPQFEARRFVLIPTTSYPDADLTAQVPPDVHPTNESPPA